MDYNISSVLKQLRKTAEYSVTETIEKLKEYNIDISMKTLYGYESGLSMPNANVFVALCKIYHCDNPMIFFENTLFDGQEQVMLEKYRALDKHGKKSVDTIINNELERCSLEYSPSLRQYFPLSNNPDITYISYRKDYAEEHYKGSTTNRFFDLADIFSYCSKELSDAEFSQKALSKAEIDARFRILDSFSKKVTKPTADFLLNAAHERTDIEVTDDMKKHDNDIMDDEDF